jgi:acetamidase/formamidase
MKAHTIHATPETCHASFSPERTPVVSVEPGHTVELFDIPDVTWGVEGPTSPTASRRRMEPNDRSGPCVCGPIAVRGARAGGTLVVRIEAIETGDWGYTWAGSREIGSSGLNEAVGVADEPEALLRYRIDRDAGMCVNQHGHRVALSPFHGCIGTAHAPGLEPAPDPWHPRRTGGNMDCRHLVAGSTLLLPIEADGALLSVGDTHAAQGDGELGGMAIECMATRSRLRLSLDECPVDGPIALTPDGLVVLAFAERMDQAIAGAVSGLLDLLGPALGLGRAEALALASSAAHARVTQVVNGVVGAHALLPAGFLGENRIELGARLDETP